MAYIISQDYSTVKQEFGHNIIISTIFDPGTQFRGGNIMLWKQKC